MTDFSIALLTGRGPVEGWRHVSRAGRPAPALGFDGWPSAESEHRALLVMENLLVFVGDRVTRDPLLLPVSYHRTCRRAPDGLVALHDGEDAVWSWRPLLYHIGAFRDNRFGSQNELGYRVGLAQVAEQTAERQERLRKLAVYLHGEEKSKRGGRIRKNARKRVGREFQAAAKRYLEEPLPELAFVGARERADAILLECLTGQQRLDLLHREGFYVRGRLNRLYEVRVGNGFAVVDPTTREEKVSLCLHPETWMPDADIALATKLGIEAGEETEAELLEAANPTLLPASRPATDDERAAARLERRFLPAG